MKRTVFPHTVAFLILGAMAPLCAQNLVSSPDLAESRLKAEISMPPGSHEVPAVERAQAGLAEDQPVFAAQDSATLEATVGSRRDVDSVVDLDVLRNPSPYRKVMVSTGSQPYEVAAKTLETGLAEISAVYRESGKTDESSDCEAIALSVEQRVKLDPSKVLEIVELEVGANPGCACEIVKMAIMACEADVSKVVAIVETAIHASPESMRIISQCAIAASPESVADVQALLAKLDPNAGEAGYSSKSAKDGSKGAKVASIVTPPLPNPLDLPPSGPPIVPPTPIPPPVTDVDPCGRPY